MMPCTAEAHWGLAGIMVEEVFEDRQADQGSRWRCCGGIGTVRAVPSANQ